MSITSISISADSELEAKAQSVLADLGLDMSTAVGMFLTQVVDKRTMPFETTESIKPVRKTPKPGCMKGEIWMSNDFDAPSELVQEPVKPMKNVPVLGCMEGEIWMSDDFDAPMEEFEEYM